MIVNRKSSGLILSTLTASIISLSVNAGTMGDISTPSSFIFLEAGGSYTHTFYKDDVRTPESFTPLTPVGVASNPNDFYPKDFGGGYFGVSYLTHELLFNSRIDMFALATKNNAFHNTVIRFAPSRLTFSVDKVWGTPSALAFGLGAGAVVATMNRGETYSPTVIIVNGVIDDGVRGESVQGRTRIDPLVEAFAMYPLMNNVNMKLNVAYQIPVNSYLSNGNLNVNLGLNYALPV